MSAVTRSSERPHKSAQAKVRPPRKAGRTERAIRHKAARAAKAAAPYLITVTVILAASMWLHSPPLSWAGAGAVAGIAAMRLHEAYGWHRKGGKAAARKRRRYQGTATWREIHCGLSLRAARKRIRVTRPSLAGVRGLTPAEVGVLIGTAGRPRRAIYGSPEEFHAIFGPPRSRKSAWMAGAAVDAPGACLIASTRTDMWVHTSIPRALRGPVHVLNPGHEGGIATTFAWNPVAGCETAQGAITRAGYMMDAAPRDPSGRDAWWDRQGAVLLRLMLHAAALVRAPITDVAAWVADPHSPEPLAVLAGHPAAAPGWAADLASMLAHDGEYVQNVAKGAVTALDWLADPAMAAIACPAGSWEGLDAWEFIQSGGTVYLIGTDRPHSSLAPYFATFTAHLFDTAKEIAASSPGGRCDPPLMLVIDEPAITCPVPLDRWSAEAGGHGVTLVTGFQSRSQMAARWGEHGADTIWNNATVKLIYGGFTHAPDLEAFSSVCGDVDTWEHVKGPDGAKTKQPRQQRLFPPERIRLLPEGKALVLHRRTRPLVADVEPVWERPGYQAAVAPGTCAPAYVQEQPAIGTAQAGPLTDAAVIAGTVTSAITTPPEEARR